MSIVAADKIRLWRERPDIFVRECFPGTTPDPWQDEILRAFPGHQRISMQACKGPGKSCVLAWLIWNFMLTRPMPKIAATSITGDNLADNLWTELAFWQQKSELLKNTFTWQKTRIFANDHPETWWVSARQWSKSASPQDQGNALAGLHAEYILFVLDESGDMPDAIMASAEAALSSCKEGHIVQAGNPTRREGPLFRASTSERNLWHVVEITGDPDSPLRSPRVKIEWAREQIEKYGADNPWVMINVMGKFPTSSLNSLIGDDEVREAMARYYRPQEYDMHAKVIGVDVAREGCFDDKTEILTNDGWKLFSDLSGKEKVLTLNGDIAEWGNIDEIHKYPFDGELNLYESQKVNFCITDNHKMLVRSHCGSNKYKLKEYKDVPEKFSVRAWNGWEGIPIEQMEFATSIIMPNGGTRTKKWSFSGLDWATFLGWFISEGSVYEEKRKSGRHRVTIAQIPGVKRDGIGDLLTRMGIAWRVGAVDKQLEFTSQSIGKHLIEFCKKGAANKIVPDYMKNASFEQIEAFLEAFCLGDGSRQKNGNGRCYMTSSKQLADDIQEMLAKIGRAGCLSRGAMAGSETVIEGRKMIRKHDMYVVYERGNKGRAKSKNPYRDRDHDKARSEKFKYEGFVWCVSTPHKIIYTRRNGKPMWSGNSDSSCIFTRQGLQAFKPDKYRNIDGTQGANYVARKWKEWGADACFVDNTGGFGSSWVDNLNRLGFNPIPVHFNQRSDNERYANKRTEMMFECVEWIKNGGSIPDVPELLNALTKTTYTFKGDKLIIEPKDLIKVKLGHSPDDLDALMLTWASPVTKASSSPVNNGTSRHTYDYNALGRDHLNPVQSTGSKLHETNYNPFRR